MDTKVEAPWEFKTERCAMGIAPDEMVRPKVEVKLVKEGDTYLLADVALNGEHFPVSTVQSEGKLLFRKVTLEFWTKDVDVEVVDWP